MSTIENIPTLLGDYCIRCGTKTEMVLNEDGQQTWVCPRGHGIQRIDVAAPKTPDTAAVEEEEIILPKAAVAETHERSSFTKRK